MNVPECDHIDLCTFQSYVQRGVSLEQSVIQHVRRSSFISRKVHLSIVSASDKSALIRFASEAFFFHEVSRVL